MIYVAQMTSRYDGHIPPDWDREDPAGNLIDPRSGARIRDLDHAGGWVIVGDGTAIPAEHAQQAQDPASDGNSLLLLFGN